MTVIEASGPWVKALKRYDPGLRVRWSYEKNKWAVDAPFKSDNPDWCTPPVAHEQLANGQWVERVLPFRSEKYIQYRSKRYVVCWTTHIDRRVFNAIVEKDTYRHKNLAVGRFDDALRRDKSERDRFEAREKDDRVREGFDRVKHELRHNHNLEDGTGVSIKGIA